MEVAEMMARVEPEPKACVKDGDEKIKERSVRVVAKRVTEEKGSFVM